jgi:opacity protein-like surface antigen
MKKILACASLLLALSGPALAADLYVPEQPVSAPPAVEPVAAANGWYLRGDVSYDIMDLRGAEYFRGSNGDLHGFRKADLNNTGNLGLGVGYQVNDYFRVDTTFDYMFKSDFRGSTTGGCGASNNCLSRDTSGMTAYGLMANAYVDIGHYGMLTPYLGAGLGGNYVKWDKLKNVSCNRNNPNDCDDEVFHKGKGSWRFTYALMLGTAVDINCKLKADVGYRYRHVAGGDMFGYKLNGGPGYDKGLNIHEARAGLRYNFGEEACQQAYLPPVDMPQQQPVFK